MFALLPLLLIISNFTAYINAAEEQKNDDNRTIIPHLHFSIVIHPTKPEVTQASLALYTFVVTKLARFKAYNPDDIKNLLTCLKDIEAFRNSHNNEYNELSLGSFAYIQQPSAKQMVTIEASPYQAALCFYRMHMYRNALQDNKVTPTIEDWQKSEYNKKLCADQERAFGIGESRFGIVLNRQEIDFHKPPFQPIATTVAIKELRTLATNVEGIMNYADNYDRDPIKNLADVIYLNILGITETQ